MRAWIPADGSRTSTNDEALAAVRAIRPLMRASAERRGYAEHPWVYRRVGPAVPALRHADPVARPRRRQPHRLLVRGLPVVKRVGHKGADLVAPGNTVESFEAALGHGVDMIEFDVLRLQDGRLVLAHDYEDAGGAARSRSTRGSTTSPATSLRGRGARRGPEAARATSARWWRGSRTRGLGERSLISTTYPESLDVLGRLAPGAAARLVGPARAPRLHEGRARRVRPARARLRAAGACRRRPPRCCAPARCEAVMSPLAARQPGARAIGARSGRRRCTSGPWTTPPRSQRLSEAGRGRRDHQRSAPVRPRQWILQIPFE